MKGSGMRNLASSLIILCCVLLISCERETPAQRAILAVENFHNTAEMSQEREIEHINEIEQALRTEEGIGLLTSAYRESRDDGFKERLLFVAWGLSFKSDPGVRKKLSTLLTEALESETNLRLRKWAAAGLVQCADTGMEDLFLSMLQSNESSLWNHGATGLWKIGTSNAIRVLTGQVTVKRTNAEFAGILKSMVTQNSNQWTSYMIQTLNPDSLRK